MSGADGTIQWKIDNNSSTYRSALLTAGISMSDSPLDHGSAEIHHDLGDIFLPLPCIPGSWVSQVNLFVRKKTNTQFPALTDSKFLYDESTGKPNHLEQRQADAIYYAFFQRHIDIQQDRLHGKNESEWRNVTITNVIAKILNPLNEFTEL